MKGDLGNRGNAPHAIGNMGTRQGRAADVGNDLPLSVAGDDELLKK
ncbi:hypothetical protein ACO0LF_30495 [Undibacterium sp. Di27W]